MFRLANPVFAGLFDAVVRPTAIITRAAEWVRDAFAAGAGGEPRACTRCGREVAITRYLRAGGERHPHGLFASCGGCGEQVSSSAAGLAIALPQVRRFRRQHSRIRLASTREIDAHGLPALVVRYEDALGPAGVDVVFARD